MLTLEKIQKNIKRLHHYGRLREELVQELEADQKSNQRQKLLLHSELLSILDQAAEIAINVNSEREIIKLYNILS